MPSRKNAFNPMAELYDSDPMHIINLPPRSAQVPMPADDVVPLPQQAAPARYGPAMPVVGPASGPLPSAVDPTSGQHTDDYLARARRDQSTDIDNDYDQQRNPGLLTGAQPAHTAFRLLQLSSRKRGRHHEQTFA